ncbi:hypothetical protein O97_00245 [Bartonella henselae str. Zeus]|nr:hypothetical protein Q653_00635 [Bartonella henselae JK 42]ETS12591.1 hypothetical protein Q652_00765 [Bartonella henselae JK 41]KEC58347.1 hypothetical protein O97_00245 [Bartonella henselae str. Zeus]KEC61266.1 hypothetical protein O95_00217 [Bartonella henselae JK 53]
MRESYGIKISHSSYNTMYLLSQICFKEAFQFSFNAFCWYRTWMGIR